MSLFGEIRYQQEFMFSEVHEEEASVNGFSFPHVFVLILLQCLLKAAQGCGHASSEGQKCMAYSNASVTLGIMVTGLRYTLPK